jgi:hypothetical protein
MNFILFCFAYGLFNGDGISSDYIALKARII